MAPVRWRLALLGVVACVLGAAMLCWSLWESLVFYDAYEIDPYNGGMEAGDLMLAPGEEGSGELVITDADGLCMVVAEVESRWTPPGEAIAADMSVPPYEVPYSLEVASEDGTVLLSRAGRIHGKSSFGGHAGRGPNGASASMEHELSKFRSQRPGRFMLHARLGAESDQDVEIVSVRLTVYEGVDSVGPLVSAGFWLGVISILLGVTLVLTPLVRVAVKSAQRWCT